MKTIVHLVFLSFLLVEFGNSQTTTGDRTQTISNIFDIPIQTLTAISKFLQGTRPLGEIIQNQQFQTSQRPQQQQYQQYQQYQRPSNGQTQYYNSYNRRPSRSRAARIAGLYLASDGSGFRI